MELLAKEEGVALDAQELVEWATQALVAGHDSPALVALAGLDLDVTPTLIEAVPLFRASLVELGIGIPSSREEILRTHGLYLARQISTGSLTPSEGVARMESEVVGPLGHPDDLMPWCYLTSDLHPETLTDLHGSEWDRYVLELARRMQGEFQGR